MKYTSLPTRQLALMIEKYIDDAARLAAGAEFQGLNCYLDGIKDPDGLADAIKAVGAEYLRKLTVLAKADPVVRGETISIYAPKPPPTANAPSREDEAFMISCRKQLLERGFVLASDADIYEAIAAKYPGCAHPARVRGAEARRWLALHKPDVVASKAMKAARKGFRR